MHLDHDLAQDQQHLHALRVGGDAATGADAELVITITTWDEGGAAQQHV